MKALQRQVWVAEFLARGAGVYCRMLAGTCGLQELRVLGEDASAGDQGGAVSGGAALFLQRKGDFMARFSL